MPQTDQTTNGFDPFGPWQAMRDKSMDAWSKMMLDLVHSEAYSNASARWLDTYLNMSQTFQKLLSESVSHTLGHARIASNEDVERLSDRVWNLELKLDDLDARLDEVVDLLKEAAGRERAIERAVERERAALSELTAQTAKPAEAAKSTVEAAKRSEEPKPEPKLAAAELKPAGAEPKVAAAELKPAGAELKSPGAEPKPAEVKREPPVVAAVGPKHEEKPVARNGAMPAPAPKPLARANPDKPVPPKPQPRAETKEKG